MPADKELIDHDSDRLSDMFTIAHCGCCFVAERGANLALLGKLSRAIERQAAALRRFSRKPLSIRCFNCRSQVTGCLSILRLLDLDPRFRFLDRG
jgi:hypothetical protein